MITWLKIQNFKNLADVEQNFGPINVVIGPNGCGKSSLLQAIDFLRAFFYSSIDVYLQERGYSYTDLPNLRRTGKTVRWHLKAELGPDDEGKSAGMYEYMVSTRRWRYLGVGEERLIYCPHGGEARTLLDREGRKLKEFPEMSPREDLVLERMPCSMIANLDPKQLKKFPEMLHFRNWITGFRSYLIWDPKVLRLRDRGRYKELGPSGEHLAPVLANLKRTEPKRYQELVARIRRLFPTVTDISVRGAKGWGWQEISLLESGKKNVQFNSQQMSDGVLRLLAVCSFLYCESPPSLLTFEEPENGIHPQLIEETIGILDELTKKKPPRNCQVFITTHNPYVLDQFIERPQNVYVMERGKPQEGARMFRLSETTQVDLIKTLYKHSLGEAWFSGLIGGTARGGK